MTLIPPGSGKRRPTEQEVIALELVSGLMMVIGLIGFAYLFYAIVTNGDIREATQGPAIPGIGLDIREVVPQPSVVNQAHLVLSVTDGSAAAQAGLQSGDILLQVGDIAVDPTTLTSDQALTIVTDAAQRASGAGGTTLPIEVDRGGQTVTITLPLPENFQNLGFETTFVQPQDLSPYVEMRPIQGGPADLTGVKNGDRLISIDGEDISGWSIDQIRARLKEANVKLSQDDFEITVDFLRPQSDHSLKEETRTVPKNVAPTLTIAYLKSFGFVVPLIVIILGILLIRLGMKLRGFDVIAARWTLVVLMWLMIGLVITSLWAFWVGGKGGLVTKEPFNFGKGISHAVPLLLAIIPMALAYSWLNRTMVELFPGDEALSSRNTRFAWTLLIPTVAVLALIAARPLEQTFIRSLTDDEFGTSRPARFVGLDNYVNLASFKLTTVDCKKDDTGQCATTPNGSIVWELSSIEQSERDKLRAMTSAERKKYVRYQEASTWQLPASDSGLRLLGKDPRFLNSFFNTLRFSISSVVLELSLGMAIALVVNYNFRGRGLMRTAMLVPWAIPTVVSAVLWQVILRGDQTGIFNKLLIDVGLIDKPHQWLAATGPWMNSIIAIDVWKTAPFMALLLLAGLQTIPGDIYEAASVDGASKVRQFFTITLPLLRPTIAVALVFRTLDALRAFDVFQVLLDSTRPSMASYNYDRLVLSRLDGYASAVGVLIFIIILLFTVVYVRFVGVEQE